MMIKFNQLSLLVTFFAAVILLQFYDGAATYDSELMLTISTFLFSIFAGFFIARQGSRFDAIRSKIVEFDGAVSSLYRFSRHISPTVRKKAAAIILQYYRPTVSKHTWDLPFNKKANIIRDLNDVYAQHCKKLKQDNAIEAMDYSLGSLEHMQVARKSILSLKLERIPVFQWLLIYILALVLIASVVLLPLEQVFITSILKSAFITVVVAVIILLHDFDNLRFFERAIGEESGKDVLRIVEADATKKSKKTKQRRK